MVKMYPSPFNTRLCILSYNVFLSFGFQIIIKLCCKLEAYASDLQQSFIIHDLDARLSLNRLGIPSTWSHVMGSLFVI